MHTYNQLMSLIKVYISFFMIQIFNTSISEL